MLFPIVIIFVQWEAIAEVENRVVSLKSISPGRGCDDFLVLILNKHGLGAF